MPPFLRGRRQLHNLTNGELSTFVLCVLCSVFRCYHRVQVSLVCYSVTRRYELVFSAVGFACRTNVLGDSIAAINVRSAFSVRTKSAGSVRTRVENYTQNRSFRRRLRRRPASDCCLHRGFFFFLRFFVYRYSAFVFFRYRYRVSCGSAVPGVRRYSCRPCEFDRRQSILFGTVTPVRGNVLHTNPSKYLFGSWSVYVAEEKTKNHISWCISFSTKLSDGTRYFINSAGRGVGVAGLLAEISSSLRAAERFLFARHYDYISSTNSIVTQ